MGIAPDEAVEWGLLSFHQQAAGGIEEILQSPYGSQVAVAVWRFGEENQDANLTRLQMLKNLAYACSWRNSQEKS